MTQKNFIKEVAHKTKRTLVDTKEVIDAAFETIAEIMENGDDVSIYKFGKFYTIDTAEREGRNPQTGEPLVIAARKTPRFKASKNLKTVVND